MGPKWAHRCRSQRLDHLLRSLVGEPRALGNSRSAIFPSVSSRPQSGRNISAQAWASRSWALLPAATPLWSSARKSCFLPKIKRRGEASRKPSLAMMATGTCMPTRRRTLIKRCRWRVCPSLSMWSWIPPSTPRVDWIRLDCGRHTREHLDPIVGIGYHRTLSVPQKVHHDLYGPRPRLQEYDLPHSPNKTILPF